MSGIYLDNSATTRIRDEVREEMQPFLGEQFGNPSSIHRIGRAAKNALEEARARVAKLVNCSAEEIYFSPCGTYSNNAAIIGGALALEAEGAGKHLITTPIEHPSCLGPAKYLEGRGWEVTYLPVSREGLVDIERFRRALKRDTSLVSIMWANNEVGSLQPIQELASIARDHKAFFHTDCVQIAGKVPVDLAGVPVSTLALSGHKFHAPKGVGVLFKRRGVVLNPLFFGGGQEQAIFPGTHGLANIVGIGKAAELAAGELDDNARHLIELQKILIESLKSIERVRLTGPQDVRHRLPGHVSVIVEGGEGEALVLQASMKGLLISSASACHRGVIEPSHVLTALGASRERALGSIRLSAGRENTADECRRAVEILSELISQQRQSVAASGAAEAPA